MGWAGRSGWGTCVYLWWVYVDVWQNLGASPGTPTPCPTAGRTGEGACMGKKEAPPRQKIYQSRAPGSSK